MVYRRIHSTRERTRRSRESERSSVGSSGWSSAKKTPVSRDVSPLSRPYPSRDTSKSIRVHIYRYIKSIVGVFLVGLF